MLSSVEQAFVGRDEKRAPLKTPAWEASIFSENAKLNLCLHMQYLITLFVLVLVK